MPINAYEREWYQCMEAGNAAISRAYALERFRREGIPSLSIFHLPSFEDCFAWTVYKTGDRQYMLQTVIWRQRHDGERMFDPMQGLIHGTSPEPTLEEQTSTLDADWFEERLALLGKIVIPSSVHHPFGIDGESFGVHLMDARELEWWCDGPPEWREIAAWTRECIDYFRRSAVR